MVNNIGDKVKQLEVELAATKFNMVFKSLKVPSMAYRTSFLECRVSIQQFYPMVDISFIRVLKELVISMISPPEASVIEVVPKPKHDESSHTEGNSPQH